MEKHIVCTNCLKKSPEGAQFCMFCGKDFQDLKEKTDRFFPFSAATEPLPPIEKTSPIDVEIQNQQKAETDIPQPFVSKMMIGRQNELDALNELSDILLAGIGWVGIVYGDPGSGKSRLISEWKKNLFSQKKSKNILWAEGKNLSNEKNLSFNLLNSLLLSILNINETASDNKKLNQLTQLIKKINTTNKPFVLTTLAHLLRLPLDENNEQNFLHLEPQVLTQQYHLALKEFIQSLSKEYHLTLIIENLQWADEASLDLLNSVIQLSASSPVLIGLVSRPDWESPRWQMISTVLATMRGRLRELSLNNLSIIETNELICNLLEINQPPKSFVELIFQKSEGNPLFIEETIQTLINQKAIERKKGYWSFQQLFPDFEVSPTIRDILLEKVNHLSRESKDVLNIASILGREFQVKVLKDVLRSYFPEIQLSSQLSLLENRGLIKLSSLNPEVTYKFQYSLLQEVIYKANDPALVKDLHRSIADSIIALYPDSQDSLAPTLAHHFNKAQNKQKASIYYSKAAQNALRKHAPIDAEKYFRLALSITQDDKDKAELLSGLGETLAQQVRHSEAIEVWQNAVQLFHKQHNFSKIARLYAWMARSAWWNNEGGKNLFFCLEGLRETNLAPDSPDLAFLIHETGRAYYFNNEMEKAQEYCERALKMANKLHAYEVQAEALATMGILPILNPQKSIAALRASIKISEEHMLNNSASRAYINLAAVVENIGEIRMARDYRLKALMSGKKSGGISDEFYIILSIINAQIWLGNFSDARERIANVKYLGHLELDPFSAGFSIGLLEAQLERQMGNFSKANELITKFIDNEQAISHSELVDQGNYLMAEIMLESILMEDKVHSPSTLDIASNLINTGLDQSNSHQPDFYKLCSLSVITYLQGDFEKGESIFNEIGNDVTYHPEMTFNTFKSLADARISNIKKDYKNAIQKFDKCIPLFEKLEAKWWLAHIALEMAIVYIRRNEPEDNEIAQSLLREALAVFKELDCDFYPNVIIEKLRIVKQQSRVQAISNRENKRELNEAGKVQTSFIPVNLPKLKGWDIEAIIEPARETSGDFYDFIELSEGKIGVTIADVGDKGAGAALYMAMCRTLFRIFASEFPDSPDKVLDAVNKRIIADTHSGIFLTVVYGVLDTHKSTFTYSNAGHNPPCLIRTKPETQIIQLNKTGKLVGIFNDTKWNKKTIKMEPTNVLVLYTDGVTEAQNENNAFYGMNDFCKVMKAGLNLSAKDMISQMTKDVHEFIGESQILDDITLMVIKKTD